MSVAIQLIQYKPKILALGTSRIRAGFDAEVLQEFSQGEAFYNAGFPGASFEEIYFYFLHAVYLQPNLKTVLLGIDLFSFNSNRNPQSNFTPLRLFKRGMIFSDFKKSLFSRKAIIDSYKTFYRSLLDRKEPNPILGWGESEYLKKMLNTDENYGNFSLDKIKVEKFAELVAICKEKAIDLKVFICPLKATYWQFYYENDLWQYVEELKRQLCAIYPLWDFSGYNPLTTEMLECTGNSLYHECSHFTPYTGNLLLQRMYNKPSSIDLVGFLLTPETVEGSLLQIHKDRQKWVHRNKQESASVQACTQ